MIKLKIASPDRARAWLAMTLIHLWHRTLASGFAGQWAFGDDMDLIIIFKRRRSNNFPAFFARFI